MSILDRLALDAMGGTFHLCPTDGVAYMIIGDRCRRCGEAIYPSTPLHPDDFYSRHDPGSYVMASDNINVFKG